MMNKQAIVIGLGAMLALPLVAWASDGAMQGDGTSLEAMIAEAESRSEELSALQDRIAAAEAMVRPARALPDPMASAGLQNIPVGKGIQLDQDMMSSVMLMLSQEVPPGETRRLRGDVQGDEAAMLQAQWEDRRNDIVRRVKRAYIDVQYREAALAIAQQNQELSQEMLSTAEARYATGRGTQQDVFQAQVRLSRMIDMVVMQKRERAAAATRLNKLLYRPPDREVPKLEPLVKTPVEVQAESLRARTLEANPQLREMVTRVAQAAKSERLAKLGLRPNLNFAFTYMIRDQLEMDPNSGDDMWSATVGLNLPWVYRRDKVDQEVKAAGSTHSAAESDVAAMQNELSAMVDELLIDIGRAEEQLSLVETGLLPQAEGAYSASRTAYSTGKSGFLSLLDDQMNLANLELERVTLLADHERSVAEVEYTAGGSIEGAATAQGQEVSSDGS